MLKLPLILMLTAAGLLFSGATASSTQPHVFIKAAENYLLFAYPKTPFITDGRIYASFPYTLLVIGDRNTKLISKNEIYFSGHHLRIDTAAKRLMIDTKNTSIPLKYDGESGVPFVQLASLLKAIGVDFSYRASEKTLLLKGNDYFFSLLNSGAGTVFDNSTPTPDHIYPTSFTIDTYKDISNPLNNNIKSKTGPLGNPMFNFQFSVNTNQAKSLSLYLLYSYFNYDVGHYNKIDLKDSNIKTEFGLTFACQTAGEGLNCKSSVPKYNDFPNSNKLNPLKFLVFKAG